MIQSIFENIEIAGITTAVPTHKDIIQEKYTPVFGQVQVEQFSKTTGVLERRVSIPEQTASDLAFVAARELIDNKRIHKQDIGILIFVTQSPDYKVPATACVLHKRLELSKDCIAFDINLGCSGYVYGIQTVCAMMQAANIKYGLLLVGDTPTDDIAPRDRSAVMLFGESGSATLLKKGDASHQIKTAFRTDGNGFKAIITPAGAARNRNASRERTIWGDENERSDYNLYMNGVEVFGFTISEVPGIINEFLEESDTEREEYDSFVFHQANCYILKQVMKRCKIPKDKCPISMDRYGNTSITSIPLTICDRYGGEEKGCMKNLLTCGFGVGLSWGIAALWVKDTDIYPIIESDEYYTEGEVAHE